MDIQRLYEIFLSSRGISTDTRKLEKDTIFFALKGASFNGNEFAHEALEAGCTYAVVDEDEYADREGCILVKNVLQTLQDLANHHRNQFDIPVIGITGSNGKTTTKELVAAVLSKKYNVLVTQGNLNNHLGVPFTLLRLDKSHEIAIIEMGANKPGDIQELVDIAEPNYGLITNVGSAHLEGFGSFEGVLRTKTELYRFIDQKGGLLFVNQDDAVLKGKLPNVSVYTYGEHAADVTGELLELNPFVKFEWRSKSMSNAQTVSSNLIGRYNLTNFLAAAAIGTYFEVSPDDVSLALEEYQPSNNRSQIKKTDRNTLIVDCYNANVTSMTAAINSLVETDHPKKLAIIGDMLELGAFSPKEHQAIVDLLNKEGLKAVLVGKEFGKTKTDYATYPDFQTLLKEENLSEISEHLVLLKGSRGIRLENLIEHL